MALCRHIAVGHGSLPTPLFCCSRGSTKAETMQVVVLSATTGELVWEHTSSSSFWQIRGWELRGWLCEAIHCALVLFCDSACPDNSCCVTWLTSANMLTAQSLQFICFAGGIADPTGSDLQQATDALYTTVIEWGYGQSCREGLHMRVLLPENPRWLGAS